MLLMSRKDERETFQLRNGAVIFSEIKEMQAECIELRAGRVALRSIRYLAFVTYVAKTKRD